MSELPEDAPPGRKLIWMAGGAVALVALVLLATIGRDGDQPSAGGNTTNPPVESVAEQSQRQLLSMLDGMRPERLGVSSDLEGQVNDLNFWWHDQPAAAKAKLSAEEAELVRKLLGEQAVEFAAAERFSDRDAGHIRNSLLFRAMAQQVAALAERDVEKCVAAFDLVTRQMTLAGEGAPLPPLTAFEMLLVGRGTASDRAWAFAELLRQLNIDCVVLAPRGADETGYWLVGAIVPGEGVYLFDPAVGLPIPGSADRNSETVLVSQPATLAEVRANDALLRQFDVPGGAAYPVTADTLRQVSARLITHAGFSASRQVSLESALPGDYAAILADGLARSATREVGLLERVVQAGSEGGWLPEDVAVWDYPERQTAAFHAAGGEGAPGLEQIMSILRGPRIVRTQNAPDGGIVRVLSDSSQPLRYVRVQQLRGDFADALTSYGAIRSAYNYEPDAVNQAAADEAAYWIGVCQYELGRYPATIETVRLYRRTWASGTRIDEMPLLQALAEAQQTRFQEAAQVLSEAGSAGPTAARDSFLIRRWRARQDRTPASE